MGFSSTRGGRAVFPPQEGERLRETLRQPPETFGVPRTRWRLADLRTVVPELTDYTLSGISRLLTRLGIHRVRGRLSLHSPDPAYRPKLALIERARAVATARPESVRFYYVDEMHICRQPTLAPIYAPRGEEPRVPLASGRDWHQRYAGALDIVSGRVEWLTGMKIGIARLCRLLRRLRAASPDHRLLVVWDNWDVHRHPTVVNQAALLEIELLWLPTYAPWTNPIEKLWRWLRQEVLHAHRWADDWATLRDQVAAFLNRFAQDSPDLLRVVGLLPD